MKRKWLWVWAGVLFLLGMFPPFVCLDLYRPSAADRAFLGPRAWVSAWCATPPTATPPLAWSRAGPRKSFATHLEFLIAADVDLLWLDHRGPPGPCGCSRLRVRSCNAVGQVGSVGNRQDTSLPNFSVPQRPDPKLGVFQQPLAKLEVSEGVRDFFPRFFGVVHGHVLAFLGASR
jgi:hypothetical protein